MKNLNFLVLLTCTLFLINTTIARGSGGSPFDSLTCLQVEGRLVDLEEGEDMESRIELLRSNVVVDSIMLEKGKNKFTFVLKKNEYYSIRVVRKGYIHKYLCINTAMRENSDDVYRFMFNIKLIKTEHARNFDHDALDYPIAIIHYDEKRGYFDYNKNYTRDIKKRLRWLSSPASPEPLKMETSVAGR